MESNPEKDFFIGYTQADRHWAEWVAWELEEAGYAVIMQAWDFKPGANFLERMDTAVKESGRTLLILTPAALDSRYVREEWTAALKQDRLVPVRVEECDPQGLLGARAYIDLVGLDEEKASSQLLAALAKVRSKPSVAPQFPFAQPIVPIPVEQRSAPKKPLTYPGSALPDPSDLIPFLHDFQDEHPEQRQAVFIMMRFGTSPRHDQILTSIRKALSKHGIQALRADDRAYADFVMTNIRTYMHGCGFGIAVFERIESESHNPNVALEVGYMMALGKSVCLLKDRTLSTLPTDVMGSLYWEFDIDDLDASIAKSLNRWLKSKRIIS